MNEKAFSLPIEMSLSVYHGGYDSDDDYYSPPDENNPWVWEKDIGKGGFGLVKLYINQVLNRGVPCKLYALKTRAAGTCGLRLTSIL